MTFFEEILNAISKVSIPILDDSISLSKYTLLDLSVKNVALKELNMTDPVVCQSYINSVLKKNNAVVAYGGYLEQRGLYSNNTHFNGLGQELRNIHLGVDFWAKAGTKVLAPISGKVHSFKNNRIKGDYGPTIILSHSINDLEFYTLYGHLSLESLDGLYIGKEFPRGQSFAFLGTPEVNVNYAPHLHFQLIKDIETYKGNYIGVCTTKDKEYYTSNCPNPRLLLKV